MSLLRNIVTSNYFPDTRVFPESRDRPGERYRYRSLGLASGGPSVGWDEGDTRLLELLPHRTGAGRIRCRLHHYLILFPVRRVEYTAVSYVWGTGEEDHLIVIDGRGWEVTKNLHTLLWRLRQPDRSVFLWIDALCIAQHIVAEKQVQIGMMDNIYGCAHRVVVYLGEGSNNSDLAPRFAELLVDKLLPLNGTGDAETQIEERSLERYGLPPTSDTRWKALRDLFHREWFYRKWTIQEYALAKRLTMQCGDWEFDGDLLSGCYSLCLQHGLYYVKAPDSHEPLTITKEHPFYTLLVLRGQVRHNLDVNSEEPGPTLPQLLVNTHYARVTIAHDAIYSLLDVYKIFPNGDLLTLPYPLFDYNKPVREVFTEYTFHLDWATELVSLLEVAGLPKNVTGLPSWVPDWSSCSLRKPLARSGRAIQYNASNRTERPLFAFDRSQRTLRVHGGRFDVVAMTSAAIWEHDEHKTELPGLISRLFQEIWGSPYRSHVYPNDEDISSILYRTLTGFANSEQPDGLAKYLQLCREYKVHLDTHPNSRHVPAKFQEITAGMRDVCRKRKLCLTAKQYVGQIPSETRPGDAIFIVPGERVPFVLRPSGTRWQLIGDAYVHGIMRGEGLNRLDGGIVDITLV